MRAKMRKVPFVRWYKLLNFWFVSFCIVFLLFTSCGKGPGTSFDTGSIAFSVRFNGVSYEGSELHALALDCDDAGVETVVAEIYDEASLYLTSGGPWLCSAHTGTIVDVPAGTNRTIVVLGKDINGNVLYRGEKSGITVTAGQTTNAGTIEVEPFNPPFDPPTLLSPTDGATVTSGSYSFEWESIAEASDYQIHVSTDSNFTSTVIDETISITSYTPTTALSANTYYWRVRAEESSGGQSAWSEVWSFTVSAEPVPPAPPTNVTATAGDEQVTISWDTVSGATSYNIYWSTSSGVSSTSYEGKIEDITETSYTHTGLTNGTTYYYVVIAVNDYGESDESEEVPASPSVPTYPDTVVDAVSVGDSPRALTATPDGSYVYVVNAESNTVTVIQTSDNTTIDAIPVGNYPRGVAVTPNGEYLYVANTADDTVSVIRTVDNSVVGTIPVGDYPRYVAITPDGSYVYVTNRVENTVSVIKTEDNSIIDTIPVSDGPYGLEVTPDGSYVYVASQFGDVVSVIRTSDNSVVDTISVGINSLRIAITPDGSYVYVTGGDNNFVSVIRTSDNSVVDTIPVGASPQGIALTPDGSFAYVGNWLDDTVSVIQTSNNMVVDTINVDDGPTAITHNGTYVYVTSGNNDMVSVIGYSLFSDSFEYTDSPSNYGWEIAYEPASTSTDKSYLGERSLYLGSHGTVDYPMDEISASSVSKISLYYYDDMLSGTNWDLHAYVRFDSSSKHLAIGWYNSPNYDVNDTATSVSRSSGWHHFEWVMANSKVSAFIDGIEVASEILTVSTVSKIRIEVGTETPLYGYFDQVVVCSD
jgi:YVTN family beta-propeller protein